MQCNTQGNVVNHTVSIGKIVLYLVIMNEIES